MSNKFWYFSPPSYLYGLGLSDSVYFPVFPHFRLVCPTKLWSLVLSGSRLGVEPFSLYNDGRVALERKKLESNHMTIVPFSGTLLFPTIFHILGNKIHFLFTFR